MGALSLTVQLAFSCLLFIYFVLLGQVIQYLTKTKTGIFIAFFYGILFFGFAAFIIIEFINYYLFLLMLFLLINVALLSIGLIKKVFRFSKFDAYLLIATLFVLWFTFQRFYLKIPNFVLTSVTSGNNDLGSYIIQSANLTQNGFGPKSLIANTSLGAWSHFDHTGIMLVLAFLSKILGLKTFNMAGCLVFIAFFGVTFMVKEILSEYRLKNIGTFSVIAFSLCSPYFLYLVINGFVAHLFGILEIGVALIVTRCERNQLKRIALFFVIFVAQWFTSPEYVVISCVVIIAFSCLELFSNTVKKSPEISNNENTTNSPWPRHLISEIFKLVRLRLLSIVVGLGLSVVALGTFRSAFLNAISVVQRQDIAGWTVDVFNFFSWISIRDIGTDPISPFNVGMILLFSLFIVQIYIRSLIRNSTMQLEAISIVITLEVLTILSVLRWGQGAYQTWKIAITFSVFVIPFLFGPFLVKQNMLKNLLIFFLIAISIFNISQVSKKSWLAYTGNELTFEGRYIGRPVVELVQNLSSESSRIFVDTSSMYMNMVIPSILKNGSSSILGLNYFGVVDSQLPDNKDCLIVDSGTRIKYTNLSISKISGVYLLLGRC